MQTDDLIFDIPGQRPSIIKVLGIGGGGGNAIKYMHEKGILDVDFIVCNTDLQDLNTNPVDAKIQLGKTLTMGRGAGNKPEIGEQAAIESVDEIIDVLQNNAKMVFLTAGMGGGTGTGAVPVISKIARDLNILTVAVLTLPFRFEGKKRYNQAIEGIRKTKEHIDALLIIDNENLNTIYGDLKLSTAFSKADDILLSAVKGITEIITTTGYINIDFADVKSVMNNSGMVVLGSAKASGKNRAKLAVENVLNSPLLNNSDISGAQNVLLNITSGKVEITMDEVSEIIEYIHKTVSDNEQIIWGTGIDPDLSDEVSVTIITTGFKNDDLPEKIDIPERIAFFPKKRIVKQQQSFEFDMISSYNDENFVITPDMDENTLRKFEKIPAFKRRRE